jgi:2,3-bisphosphoglycerate-independent phosphoglycerate mutase
LRGFPHAALEALGLGRQPPLAAPLFHLALRAAQVRDGALWLGERARPKLDDEACAQLFDALAGRRIDDIDFEILPLRTGEAVLCARGAQCCDVSDSDALFDHLHPMMRPRPLPEAVDGPQAARLATALERWLRDSRRILLEHGANASRRDAGLPPLDVAVTKWASWLDPALPSFAAQTGLRGAAVTDTALYRGLARALGMTPVDRPYNAGDPAGDMRQRIDLATELLHAHDFVHVHVKATDEAAHTKRPDFKRAIIESMDAGLAALPELAARAVVAVTGDHASPSTGALLHSGDPTPFVAAAPGLRPDAVTRFGERTSLCGEAGRLRADDVLPYLVGLANRPFFLGHRPGPGCTHALPASPEPMVMS